MTNWHEEIAAILVVCHDSKSPYRPRRGPSDSDITSLLLTGQRMTRWLTGRRLTQLPAGLAQYTFFNLRLSFDQSDYRLDSVGKTLDELHILDCIHPRLSLPLKRITYVGVGDERAINAVSRTYRPTV